MPTSNYKPRRRPRRYSLLAPFDPWGSPLCTCPFKLSLNPYTGCSFKCLYCYATAYIGVRDSAPKRDIAKRLVRDLARWDKRVPINVGTSSDPYPPEEAYYGITRRILEILHAYDRRVLITTKGTLYARRDLDILSKGRFAVTPTITTLDPGISLIVEPGAPTPLQRLEAMRAAARVGVPVGVRVDPVIPYVNDDPASLEALVEEAYAAGARFLVTSTFKARPDGLARLRAALGVTGWRINQLYRERGARVNGYLYLPRRMREEMLRPVIRAARRLGMEYATCREGLTGPEWFRAPSCDGTHLIPEKDGAGASIDRWIS